MRNNESAGYSLRRREKLYNDEIASVFPNQELPSASYGAQKILVSGGGETQGSAIQSLPHQSRPEPQKSGKGEA